MLTPGYAREITKTLQNSIPKFVFGIAENNTSIIFGVKTPDGFKAKVGVITHDGLRFVIDSADNEYCHWRKTRQELIEFLRELYAHKGDWAF